MWELWEHGPVNTQILPRGSANMPLMFCIHVSASASVRPKLKHKSEINTKIQIVLNVSFFLQRSSQHISFIWDFNCCSVPVETFIPQTLRSTWSQPFHSFTWKQLFNRKIFLHPFIFCISLKRPELPLPDLHLRLFSREATSLQTARGSSPCRSGLEHLTYEVSTGILVSC